MTLLIIGSEGFIGSNCVDYFRKGQHTLYGADLFEQPSQPYHYTKISRLSPDLDELFKTTSFDAVINAAGSGNVPYSMTHPLADFEANCLDTIRVLDAIRRYQPGCKYIHLSSAAVYGNPESLPVKEDDPVQPLSPYGWHKSMSERLCKEYALVYGLQTAILRPFSVYGPGLKKQLFWDLYQKASQASAAIELFGTGRESRDYIHVRDLVRGIECIFNNSPLKGEIYNLASGIETTINDAVQIFINALPQKKSFSFNGMVREGDPLHWRADVTRMKQLGFSTQIQLQEGLKEVAAWTQSLH